MTFQGDASQTTSRLDDVGEHFAAQRSYPCKDHETVSVTSLPGEEKLQGNASTLPSEIASVHVGDPCVISESEEVTLQDDTSQSPSELSQDVITQLIDQDQHSQASVPGEMSFPGLSDVDEHFAK